MESSIANAHAGARAREGSIITDCAEHLLYSAIQSPISGVAQLVDAVADTHLQKQTSFMHEPRQAQFGTAQWHLEQLASGVGAIVPILLAARAIRPLTNKAFERGLLQASAAPAGRLLGVSAFAESALTGFVASAVFQPSQDNGSLLEQRLKQGAIGAVTLGSMHAGTQLLGRFTGASALEASLINKAITTGSAGGGAAAIGGATESWLSGRPLDIKQLAENGYAMGFTGGALALTGGSLMKLNMPNETRLPSIDEYLARRYDGANNVEHYQVWLNMQSPAGKVRNLYYEAFDTGQRKAADLFVQMGLREPVDEHARMVNHPKYGEIPPEAVRDLKVALESMSAAERLQFVRKMQQLAKDPTITESSLDSLYKGLRETSSDWHQSKLPELWRAKEEAEQNRQEKFREIHRVQAELRKEGSPPCTSDPRLREALDSSDEAFQQSAKATREYQQEASKHTSQIAAAINRWLQARGMPPITVENGCMPNFVAAYLNGFGRIVISDKVLHKTVLDADTFGLIFHEMMHAQQDVVRIRYLADQMGVGANPSPEQIDMLNRMQIKPMMVEPDVDMSAKHRTFVEQVLAARNGEKLNARQTVQAAALIDRFSRPKPKWMAQAEKLSSQYCEALTIAKHSNEFAIARLLADINEKPAEAAERFGFSKIPHQLRELAANARKDENASLRDRTMPDEQTTENIKAIFDKQVEALDKRMRPFHKKENEHYLGTFAEQQAYPAGLLAFLFAQARAQKR